MSQDTCFPLVLPDSDDPHDTKWGLRDMMPMDVRNGSPKHLPHCIEGYIFHLQGEQLELRDNLLIFICRVTSTMSGT